MSGSNCTPTGIAWRTVLAALGALALSLLMAAGALASTLSTELGGPRVKGDPGEANVIGVTQTGGTFTITDSAGLTVADPGCTPVSGTEATCTGSFSSVVVRGEDGNDKLTLSISNLVSGPGGPAVVAAAGGGGDDLIDASAVTVPSSPGTQSFAGDAGNDTVIAGQGTASLDVNTGFAALPGEPILPVDQLITALAAGNDRLVGGAGDDNINASVGADQVEAGGGRDTIQAISVTSDIRPQDDNAVDVVNCGDGPDNVTIGTGDQVAIDCEFVIQQVTCPPGGAACDPFAVVTAAGGASASVASAAAAKKRGATVVGKSRKLKPLRSGQTGGILVRMQRRKVRKALGKRSQTRATFLTDLRKVRGKRTVGHVKKKTRFKLKR
jgi:hypothetical protein